LTAGLRKKYEIAVQNTHCKYDSCDAVLRGLHKGKWQHLDADKHASGDTADLYSLKYAQSESDGYTFPKSGGEAVL
jgi:hypothetical protein